MVFLKLMFEQDFSWEMLSVWYLWRSILTVNGQPSQGFNTEEYYARVSFE